MSSGFKRGVDNVTSFFKPKPQPKIEVHDDAIALSKEPRRGPELHLAMGRLYEQSNRRAEAAKEYDEALRLGQKNPAVLSAYAQYKARSGQFDEAIRYYQQAIKLTPNDPSLYNDLGLCYARRDRNPEAVSQLMRAIQFQPDNPLYRNNIAAVLVEMNQSDEAMRHLLAVHPEAVAHYNLGYLLHKKGQSVPAAQHFAYALQRDPTLEPAKYWLDRVGANPGERQSPTAAWPTVQRSNIMASQPMQAPPAMGAPVAPMMPPPQVGPPPEAAPLPPSLATMPTVGLPPVGYGQPDPRWQQPPQQQQPAPVVGRMPGYEGEIRRQGFDEVVNTRSTDVSRLPPADEPAPLPDDVVRKLPRTEQRRSQPVHRLPPPVVPTLD
jgi:Tfp pilus assembly protein PilF